MTDYTKLVKELRGCKDMDYCTDCPRMANGYVEFCNIKDDAAAAIEDLEGFLSEAERDRDEYEERMRKEQERVLDLQARLEEAENSVELWKDMYLTKHEPKRGEWHTELFDGDKKYQCSNCLTHWDVETRYCPFCGAKMREVQE